MSEIREQAQRLQIRADLHCDYARAEQARERVLRLAQSEPALAAVFTHWSLGRMPWDEAIEHALAFLLDRHRLLSAERLERPRRGPPGPREARPVALPLPRVHGQLDLFAAPAAHALY